MLKKILVPVDFTYESDKVLQFLRGWKKIGLKEVVLAHVLGARIHERKIIKERDKRARLKLKEREKGFKKEDLKVKSLVLKGVPHDEILKAAEKEKVSLIVTGSHGKFLFEEILFGSVSEKIGREARTPVLLIRYEYLDEIRGGLKLKSLAEKIFRKILLPTDFSSYSKKALEYLIRLKKVGAGEVVVLHTLDLTVLETEREREEQEDLATANLKKVKNELEEKNFKVKSFLKTGSPVEEILKNAAGEKASLILIGSHGRRLLAEWMAGTVSLELVRRGKFPTLVVHANDLLFLNPTALSNGVKSLKEQ